MPYWWQEPGVHQTRKIPVWCALKSLVRTWQHIRKQHKAELAATRLPAGPLNLHQHQQQEKQWHMCKHQQSAASLHSSALATSSHH
jgi:hypothetical protein